MLSNFNEMNKSQYVAKQLNFVMNSSSTINSSELFVHDWSFVVFFPRSEESPLGHILLAFQLATSRKTSRIKSNSVSTESVALSHY